mgnify:CR=1 FL=1
MISAQMQRKDSELLPKFRPSLIFYVHSCCRKSTPYTHSYLNHNLSDFATRVAVYVKQIVGYDQILLISDNQMTIAIHRKTRYGEKPHKPTVFGCYVDLAGFEMSE